MLLCFVQDWAIQWSRTGKRPTASPSQNATTTEQVRNPETAKTKTSKGPSYGHPWLFGVSQHYLLLRATEPGSKPPCDVALELYLR